MTNTSDRFSFGAAQAKQEGGVYYRYPPKPGTVEWVKMVLETSYRVGAPLDTPEGARYIQISDTLAQQMVSALDKACK